MTFLFTDIEGSTPRWEADADAMRSALVAHDKVLRTAIEAHDGFLFSHTGDGVVVAFASPRSAVDAAIDAQQELQLPVRMGIATGEAELRDGDYFGPEALDVEADSFDDSYDDPYDLTEFIDDDDEFWPPQRPPSPRPMGTAADVDGAVVRRPQPRRRNFAAADPRGGAIGHR